MVMSCPHTGYHMSLAPGWVQHLGSGDAALHHQLKLAFLYPKVGVMLSLHIHAQPEGALGPTNNVQLGQREEGRVARESSHIQGGILDDHHQ